MSNWVTLIGLIQNSEYDCEFVFRGYVSTENSNSQGSWKNLGQCRLAHPAIAKVVYEKGASDDAPNFQSSTL